VPKPDLFLKTAWQQSNIKQLLVKQYACLIQMLVYFGYVKLILLFQQ